MARIKLSDYKYNIGASENKKVRNSVPLYNTLYLLHQRLRMMLRLCVRDDQVGISSYGIGTEICEAGQAVPCCRGISGMSVA